MRTTRTLSVLAAAGILALVGCSSSSGENSVPATITETRAVPAPDSGTAPTEATGTDTSTVTPADTGAQTPAPPSGTAPPESREDLPQAPVGEEVTIAGEPATVCIHGDGWGTNIWAGNAATSCEFVSETHRTLTEGLDPTRDNIREHLKPRITVHSPVTGEDYDLECAPRDEVLISCTGGDGAAIHFY